MSCCFIPPGPLLRRLAIQTEGEKDRGRGRHGRTKEEQSGHGTNFTTISIPLEMLVHETTWRPLEQLIK